LRRKGGLVAGLALSSTALFAANAQAANTYTVTGNTDAAGTCSANSCTTLRAAINQANADGTADTITFDPSVASPITLTSALPAINDAGGLTITGPGASALTIDANHVAPVFDIPTPSTANSITGLTLTNGTSSNAGGALYNSSQLTLTNDVISNSTTSNSGGGGGIFSNGPVTLSGTTVSGNSSPADGGGIRMNSRDLTITGSTISGNTAVSRGGGIAGSNAAYITDSHITGNTTTGSSSRGGGISSPYDYLSLKGSTVSGNTSVSGGGLNLGGARYGTVVDNSTVSGNTASSGGGVLINTSRKYAGAVQLERSTVSGNQATNGAGVDVSYIGAPSPVTIQSSTLSGNTGGTNSFGGGLFVEGYLYGSLDLLNSTVSGNSATIGGGVSLGNSTHYPLVTGRYATTGSVSFDNSTIAANAGTAHAGGIYLGQYRASPSSPYQSATVGLTSTIVGANTASGISDDLERGGASTSGGFNGAFSLVQSPGNTPLTKDNVITGIGPQLGPLADNGGPTQTMLPSGTSPVIDQGKSPASLPTDQRGMPRLVDTAITNPVGGDGTDIGAVELPASSVVLPPVPPTPPPAPTPTSGLTLSIQGASLSLSSRPLLVGNQTPVTCAVKTGTLSNCVIEVQAGSKLLGSGEVISRTGATSLTTRITPTKAGLSYLKHRQLGVDATATVVASQSAAGSPTVTGNVHFLQGPSITLGLGKRSAKLSKNVVSQLNRVAKLLAGAKTVTCTAYSDNGKHDVTLTKSQASAACGRLKKDGLSGKSRVVGRGHAKPAASNQNHKGRAANRRLVISFTF
jgi:hypothetical protein